jgi:hypothetical protein
LLLGESIVLAFLACLDIIVGVGAKFNQ